MKVGQRRTVVWICGETNEWQGSGRETDVSAIKELAQIAARCSQRGPTRSLPVTRQPRFGSDSVIS